MLHFGIEKDNDIPPLTNKSPPGGSSFCVDVNKPNSLIQRNLRFELRIDNEKR